MSPCLITRLKPTVKVRSRRHHLLLFKSPWCLSILGLLSSIEGIGIETMEGIVCKEVAMFLSRKI